MNRPAAPIPCSQWQGDARAGARGFTLVELVIIAAVLVVVSSVSFPRLVAFYEGQRLRQAAIELQAHLQNSRSLAQRLQSLCTVAISGGRDATNVVVSGSGACAAANLASLDLSVTTDVRGLCVSNNGSSGPNCTTPAALSFLPLGVLAGPAQMLYLSGLATPAQACIDVGLTQIRVGFRNGNSGACDFTRT